MNKVATEDAWVVIPAYNEGEKICEVLNGVKSYFNNIIVVDDGSRDQTSLVLYRHGGIDVVVHPINLGQGAALQTGISYALGKKAKWIVTLDADGQHDPNDAVQMLKKASEEKLDICFGSRFLGETIGMTKSRRLLLKMALLFQTITTGMRMTDVHNGLRGINGSAASRITIRQNRMAHASEFVALSKLHKFRYGEFPVTICYTEYSRAKGQSSLGALAIVVDLIIAKLGK